MADEAATKNNGGQPRKRVLLRIVIAIVAFSAGTFGVRYYLHTREWVSTDDAFIDGYIVQISPKVSGYVETLNVKDNEVVKKGTVLLQIDTRDYEVRLAQAQANLEAAIASQHAAKTNVELTSITSTAALDQVSHGATGANFAVETAKAALETARLQESQKKAQVKVAQAATEEATANVAVAEAEVVRAKLDWERFKELRGTTAVTQQQVDNAEAAYHSAQAKLEASKKAVAVAEAQTAAAGADERVAAETLRQSESRLAQAKAQAAEAAAARAGADIVKQKVAFSQSQLETASAAIKQLEAAVAQVKLDLSYTTITAPEAGRVTRRTVERGAFVQPGQALLAIVPGEVWVVANYKETELTNMRPGQRAVIYVDTYPDKVFKGLVDSIQSGTGARFSLLPPENATGNYVKVVQRVPVKIIFEGEPWTKDLLAPGMSVVPEVKVR